MFTGGIGRDQWHEMGYCCHLDIVAVVYIEDHGNENE